MVKEFSRQLLSIVEATCNHLTKFISLKIGLVNIKEMLPKFGGFQMRGEKEVCLVSL